MLCSSYEFQSTRSLRSATQDDCQEAVPTLCFNPRAPCGARRLVRGLFLRRIMFQSTRSLRSATCSPSFPVLLEVVSIHALLAERDSKSGDKGLFYHIFRGVIHYKYDFSWYLTPQIRTCEIFSHYLSGCRSVHFTFAPMQYTYIFLLSQFIRIQLTPSGKFSVFT